MLFIDRFGWFGCLFLRDVAVNGSHAGLPESGASFTEFLKYAAFHKEGSDTAVRFVSFRLMIWAFLMTIRPLYKLKWRHTFQWQQLKCHKDSFVKT
jgi:hypothetical protein